MSRCQLSPDEHLSNIIILVPTPLKLAFASILPFYLTKGNIFMPNAVNMYSPIKIRIPISTSEGIILISVSINTLNSFKFFTSLVTRIIRNVRITVMVDLRFSWPTIDCI